MTDEQLIASELTLRHWTAKRTEMIRWMIAERRFSPKAAENAATTFIDTMVFVAGETGEPQFKRRAYEPAW